MEGSRRGARESSYTQDQHISERVDQYRSYADETHTFKPPKESITALSGQMKRAGRKMGMRDSLRQDEPLVATKRLEGFWGTHCWMYRWAERQRTASEETAAIRKAKDILADGVKESFLQTSSRTRRASVEESGQARTQVITNPVKSFKIASRAHQNASKSRQKHQTHVKILYSSWHSPQHY